MTITERPLLLRNTSALEHETHQKNPIGSLWTSQPNSVLHQQAEPGPRQLDSLCKRGGHFWRFEPSWIGVVSPVDSGRDDSHAHMWVAFLKLDKATAARNRMRSDMFRPAAQVTRLVRQEQFQRALLCGLDDRVFEQKLFGVPVQVGSPSVAVHVAHNVRQISIVCNKASHQEDHRPIALVLGETQSGLDVPFVAALGVEKRLTKLFPGNQQRSFPRQNMALVLLTQTRHPGSTRQKDTEQ